LKNLEENQVNIQELFINNLKSYRKEKKISQLELALRCDSAQTYISEIEVGKKFPSPDMIEKIAKALNIESWSLFQNTPIPTQTSTPRLNPSQKQELLSQIHGAVAKIVERY
jgi:transcriptional regulator with XRE-family HTH domain